MVRPVNDELTMIVRIVLALIFGAAIGFQREREGKEAGLRTHMLITVGSALFTIVSIFAFSSDEARVASGIVAGIGFLGAGTILKEGGFVKGLTTAASIWISAAIGLAAGAGMYIIATVSTFLALLILIIHPHVKVHKDERES